MEVAARIAKNTAVLYLRMAITVFISLYSTRLILSALGVADFGLFNLVGGLITMLAFINACMSEASQRFMSFAQGAGDVNRLKTIFNVSVTLHITIAIVLFLVLEIAGYIFFNYILNILPDRLYAAQLVYQFMIISTLFTVVSVPFDAVINARENMTLFAVLGVVEAMLKLIIAIAITKFAGDKLIMYGALMTLLSIFLLIVRVLYCRKYYEECDVKLTSRYDKRLLKEMASFAGWSFLGYSTSMISNYGQGIIINIFFGTKVNAGQGIANQVSGQLSTFAHTLMRALNPSIAKSEGSGNRSFMLKTAMMGSKLSFFLLMLLFVPTLIDMPFILSLWLKNVPPYAIVFCQLLLLRNLIEQLFITLVTSISAVGNIKRFQIYSSILTFFPLLISYILFYKGFEPQTLYLVFIVYSVLASINILYFAKITCGLSIQQFLNNVVVRCLFTFLIVFAIAIIPYYVFDNGWLRLVFVSLTSTLTAFISVWFVGLDTTEKSELKSLFNSKFKNIFNKINIRLTRPSI